MPGTARPAVDTETFVTSFRRKVDPLLRATGIDPRRLAVVVAQNGGDLTVSFTGPRPPAPVRQAIAVHVLEAVGALGRTVGDVDVRFVPRSDRPAA